MGWVFNLFHKKSETLSAEQILTVMDKAQPFDIILTKVEGRSRPKLFNLCGYNCANFCVSPNVVLMLGDKKHILHALVGATAVAIIRPRLTREDKVCIMSVTNPLTYIGSNYKFDVLLEYK